MESTVTTKSPGLSETSPEPTKSAKLSHDVLNVDASLEATLLESSSRHSLRIIFTSHIIHSSSFRIFEKFISIDNFFKFLFGSGVLFISIGVIFFGSLLESLFDLLLSSVLRNSKYFIRIWAFTLEFGD